jgi:hypothetical protein
MEVYIVDQAGLCCGTLKNMSCFGMCISEVTRKLQTVNGSFDAVVFGRGYNFKMQLQQKWVAEEDDLITMGIAIEDVPWGWAELNLRQELAAKEACISVAPPVNITEQKRPSRKVRLSGNC